MFNIGDVVTINTNYKAYIECRCLFCSALREGAIGTVVEIHPQTTNIEVGGLGPYRFNTEGLMLVQSKEPDWEV